jgi:hypothetical protein
VSRGTGGSSSTFKQEKQKSFKNPLTGAVSESARQDMPNQRDGFLPNIHVCYKLNSIKCSVNACYGSERHQACARLQARDFGSQVAGRRPANLPKEKGSLLTQ